MSAGQSLLTLHKFPAVVAVRSLPPRACHPRHQYKKNANKLHVLNLFSPTISIRCRRIPVHASTVEESQVTTETVTKFSKQDEESVRKSLLPLVSGKLMSTIAATY